MGIRLQSWGVRKRSVSAAAVTMTLLVGACGSSTSSAKSSSTTPTAVHDANSSCAAKSQADPNKAPVKIGLVNMDKGAVPFPGGTEGADAAARYVNCELGGVNGRPVALTTCSTDLTPAANQTCGDKFANDSSIDVVMTVITIPGASLYQALNAVGTPVYGGIATSDSDYTAPGNTYFMLGGQPASNGGQGALARQVVPNTKRIVILYDDEPGGHSGVPIIETAYGKGPSYTEISVPTSVSDVLPYVTEAVAAKPDAIIFALTRAVRRSRSSCWRRILQSRSSATTSASARRSKPSRHSLESTVPSSHPPLSSHRARTPTSTCSIAASTSTGDRPGRHRRLPSTAGVNCSPCATSWPASTVISPSPASRAPSPTSRAESSPAVPRSAVPDREATRVSAAPVTRSATASRPGTTLSLSAMAD